MAFNYDRNYKQNIRISISSIKTTAETKSTPYGKQISEQKKECMKLLDSINEFPYKPKVSGTSFYVTESNADFNKEINKDLEKLIEIKKFLVYFQ